MKEFRRHKAFFNNSVGSKHRFDLIQVYRDITLVRSASSASIRAKISHQQYPKMSTISKPKIPPVVMDSVTEQIGNTPLVKLNKLPQSLGIEATIYAKLEYFNAGGSVKDRIALRMIEEAERIGRIKPGDTLIEPTSGNT